MKIIFIDDHFNKQELNDQETINACMYEESITDYFIYCENCQAYVLRSLLKEREPNDLLCPKCLKTV